MMSGCTKSLAQEMQIYIQLLRAWHWSVRIVQSPAEREPPTLEQRKQKRQKKSVEFQRTMQFKSALSKMALSMFVVDQATV